MSSSLLVDASAPAALADENAASAEAASTAPVGGSVSLKADAPPLIKRRRVDYREMSLKDLRLLTKIQPPHGRQLIMVNGVSAVGYDFHCFHGPTPDPPSDVCFRIRTETPDGKETTRPTVCLTVSPQQAAWLTGSFVPWLVDALVPLSADFIKGRAMTAGAVAEMVKSPLKETEGYEPFVNMKIILDGAKATELILVDSKTLKCAPPVKGEEAFKRLLVDHDGLRHAKCKVVFRPGFISWIGKAIYPCFEIAQMHFTPEDSSGSRESVEEMARLSQMEIEHLVKRRKIGTELMTGSDGRMSEA